MLGLLSRILKRGRFEHIVDFGSGNGRYLLPLVTNNDLTATAVEPSVAARTQLIERAEEAGVGDRINVVETLRECSSSSETILAMALFGVLSHIVDTDERSQALSELRKLTEPEGQLVVSVPNRWRRFYRHQLLSWRRSAASSAAIEYQRQMGAGQGQFAYHLFTANALRQELGRAGLSVVETHCESILPERTVTSIPLVSRLDGPVARVLPTPVGYGLVAVCRPD